MIINNVELRYNCIVFWIVASINWGFDCRKWSFTWCPQLFKYNTVIYILMQDKNNLGLRNGLKIANNKMPWNIFDYFGT